MTVNTLNKHFTNEEIVTADMNGISVHVMQGRLGLGWPVEDIITRPVIRKGMTRAVEHSEMYAEEREMPKAELLEVMGRIKYMQNTNMSHPPNYTRLMLKRLEENGLTLADVEEVEVDLSDMQVEETEVVV